MDYDMGCFKNFFRSVWAHFKLKFDETFTGTYLKGFYLPGLSPIFDIYFLFSTAQWNVDVAIIHLRVTLYWNMYYMTHDCPAKMRVSSLESLNDPERDDYKNFTNDLKTCPQGFGEVARLAFKGKPTPTTSSGVPSRAWGVYTAINLCKIAKNCSHMWY